MNNADKPAMPTTNANGLSKREYFAAMAMQGLCANSIAGNNHRPTALMLVQDAVMYADALLKELEK